MMKQLLRKIKSNKLLTILIVITLISFFLGIFYIAILNKENKELIATSLTTFFDSIVAGKVNYQDAFLTSIINNLIILLLVWLLGISIIGIPFVVITLIFRSFILGFSFTSIIYNLGIKGVPIGIIYVLPHIINLLVTLILVYYSVSFSIMLYKYLFKRKDYNRMVVVKRYLKVLLFSAIFFLLSSIIEVFLVPTMLKFPL